jgi:glucose/arabinose dehydrogenase
VEVLKLDPFVRTETGLLGLAIDPEFASNGHVYLYHTIEPVPDVDQAVTNQIDQYRLEGERLVFVRTILSDLPGTYAHSGGRLEFGPDDKLYATIGDGPEDRPYQEVGYLGAKILRINRDGSVPADNPFEGSLVYTLGHRNPQGISWHPQSGVAFTAEHGPSRHDELNRLSPGADYGWDTYVCHKQKVTGWRRLLIRYDAVLPDSIVSMGTQFPIFCAENFTLAPSGMVFVDDANHPWFGSLFIAGLHGQHLRRFKFDDSANLLGSEIFYQRDEGRDPRLRDVEYHAGSLFIIGDSRGLTRLSPASSATRQDP